MTRCTYDDCSGYIDDAGFCAQCGRRPAPAAPMPAPSRSPSEFASQAQSQSQSESRSQSQARSRSPSQSPSESRTLSAAAGLVFLPVLPGEDPSSRVISDPEALGFSRQCRNHDCRKTISVAYAGQPTVLKGFCQICGTPYDFEPRLAPGEIVADQYEVVGPIAHGGLGWVFVARDRHLDGNHVALKGLIEPTDPVAVSLGISERRFLTSLDHPNIVRIYNFVTHDDEQRGDRSGYIVMEYLNGRSLREVLNGQRVAGERKTMQLEHVLAYGYEILVALDYMHGRGLLYCDMKPDNVILTADRIKIIDIGGVRRIDDTVSPMVLTTRYQVSRKEIRERGLTVRADIHTVGKTLEELFKASDQPRGGLAVESFRRLIQRAAHPDWRRRFESAAEMLEQLKGVLHEVVAATPGHLPAAFEPSTVFEPSPALLDGGLSTVSPLDRWTKGGTEEVFGAPPPASVVALGLPVPRTDLADPQADLLASIGVVDPRSLLDQLSEVGSSPELELRRGRAHLELGELDEAESCFRAAKRAQATAERRAVEGDPGGQEAAEYGWRVAWHYGLLALARGRPETALARFDQVYAALPGETAPKLARAFCQEHLKDFGAAKENFETVWLRDQSQTNAAFGLARLRLRLRDGQRAAAVQILDQVPKVAQHHEPARIAAVRVLSEELPDGNPPAQADLVEATRRLRELVLDGGERQGRTRDRLTAALLEMTARLDDSHEVSRKLEKSYMRLAHQATSWRDKGRLVDLAHSVHPWSLR